MSDTGSSGEAFANGVMRGFDFVDRIQGRKQERQDRADAKERQSMLDDREQQRYTEQQADKTANTSYQHGRDTQGDLERAANLKREESWHQDAVTREDRNYKAGRSDVAYTRSKEETAARKLAGLTKLSALLDSMGTEESRKAWMASGHMAVNGQVPSDLHVGVSSAAMLDQAGVLYGHDLKIGESLGHNGASAKISEMHIDPETGDVLFGVDHEQDGKTQRVGRRVKSGIVQAHAAAAGSLAEALQEAPDDATRKQMIEQAKALASADAIASGVHPDAVRAAFTNGGTAAKGTITTDLEELATKFTGGDKQKAIDLYKVLKSSNAKPEDRRYEMAKILLHGATANGSPSAADMKNMKSTLDTLETMVGKPASGTGPAQEPAAGTTADDADLMGMMGLGGR